MTAEQPGEGQSGELRRTPLHDLHVELGGKMVPFAGYAMPVQFPAGILAEHKHTRDSAGLFDVSHMGQVRLSGPDTAQALESVIPADIVGLEPGQQRYSQFLNDQAGILDDLMISNAGDHLFLVVNAACKGDDVALLRRQLADRLSVDYVEDRALLALQGPKAAEVLARHAPDSGKLVFMSGAAMRVDGVECYVTRSGYTGEDGFEISVPAGSAEALARLLLGEPEVEPVGLGARDSLRLEAGLCLYGHDIDESTTPVEAVLMWSIAKRRREEGGFPGAEVVQRQLRDGVARKRVGILPEGRAPAREGTEVVDGQGRVIGRVTSGGFGPSLGGPVAMGYVASEFAKADTEIALRVRGKDLPGRVAKMPFVPQRYYRG
ncbi:MAG TPA: glycine cleavage system aminomethyltransferase GcvT [Alphaproteobacteria bacterium]|nr:glycine cleavage system aminomethyltransferase GcvT [Alphaproteobacteria bacterium]